jgi:hypothetical protein
MLEYCYLAWPVQAEQGTKTRKVTGSRQHPAPAVGVYFSHQSAASQQHRDQEGWGLDPDLATLRRHTCGSDGRKNICGIGDHMSLMGGPRNTVRKEDT